MCSIHSGATICAGSRAAIRLRVGMRDRLSRRIGVGALISGIHCRRLGRPPTGVGVAFATALLAFAAGGPVSAQNATWSVARTADTGTRRENWVPAARTGRHIAAFSRARPRSRRSSRPTRRPTSSAMSFSTGTLSVYTMRDAERRRCWRYFVVTGQTGVVNNSNAHARPSTFQSWRACLELPRTQAAAIGIRNVDIFNRSPAASVAIFGNFTGRRHRPRLSRQANIVNTGRFRPSRQPLSSANSHSAGHCARHQKRSLAAARILLEASSAANATITNVRGGATAFGSRSARYRHGRLRQIST